MSNLCGCCSMELENGVCLVCSDQNRTTTELARDMVEILLLRQDACNEFLVAAARALEKDAENPEAIIAETTELMLELSIVDETVKEMLEYIDEEESCCCIECLCCGCPYCEECDGDCYFEDEDFLREKDIEDSQNVDENTENIEGNQ